MSSGAGEERRGAIKADKIDGMTVNHCCVFGLAALRCDVIALSAAICSLRCCKRAHCLYEGLNRLLNGSGFEVVLSFLPDYISF